MTEFVSIFDLDHTLLVVNSSYHFSSYLRRIRVFPKTTFFYCLAYYVRHKWLGMSIDQLHQKAFECLFKGRCQADIQRHAQDFVEKELEKMVYEPVRKKLKEAQQQGHHTVILSSSPDFLVKPIAEALGVHEWQATQYEQDAKGCFHHIRFILEGEGKAHYLRQLAKRWNLSPSAITAYSDSHLDLPLLEAAGRAVGVRPNARLNQVCRKNGWEIL